MVSKLCTTIGKSWSWQRQLECGSVGLKTFYSRSDICFVFPHTEDCASLLTQNRNSHRSRETTQQCLQTSVRSKNDFKLFNMQLWFSLQRVGQQAKKRWKKKDNRIRIRVIYNKGSECRGRIQKSHNISPTEHVMLKTPWFRQQHRRRLCFAVRQGELTCIRETAIKVWLHCSCPTLHYAPCEQEEGVERVNEEGGQSLKMDE